MLGFMKENFLLISLMIYEITGSVDVGGEADVKVSVNVCHNSVIDKQIKYRLEKCKARHSQNRLNCLAQQVVISTMNTIWKLGSKFSDKTGRSG